MSYFKALFDPVMNYPRYCYGIYKLSTLEKPLVTIFGGKRVTPETFYYKQANELATLLAKQSLSILTGGGPGVMESALCGAKAIHAKKALGIGVVGVDADFKLSCDQEVIFSGSFADRKKLLINYSSIFIAFPGGIGTLDEILEVLNLVKTKKIPPCPVILIGSTYWNYITLWLQRAIDEGYIVDELTTLVTVTDDIHYAAQLVETLIKKRAKE
jgi:uncharacterized protein (TIGR00730 family)